MDKDGQTATSKRESREILLISSGKQQALIGDGPWGPLIGTNFFGCLAGLYVCKHIHSLVCGDAQSYRSTLLL